MKYQRKGSEIVEAEVSQYRITRKSPSGLAWESVYMSAEEFERQYEPVEEVVKDEYRYWVVYKQIWTDGRSSSWSLADYSAANEAYETYNEARRASAKAQFFTGVKHEVSDENKFSKRRTVR